MREVTEHLSSQRSECLFELVVSCEDSIPEVRDFYGFSYAAGLSEQVLHCREVEAAFHPRERRLRTQNLSAFSSADTNSYSVLGIGNLFDTLEAQQQDIAGGLLASRRPTSPAPSGRTITFGL